MQYNTFKRVCGVGVVKYMKRYEKYKLNQFWGDNHSCKLSIHIITLYRAKGSFKGDNVRLKSCDNLLC